MDTLTIIDAVCQRFCEADLVDRDQSILYHKDVRHKRLNEYALQKYGVATIVKPHFMRFVWVMPKPYQVVTSVEVETVKMGLGEEYTKIYLDKIMAEINMKKMLSSKIIPSTYTKTVH